MGQRGIAGTKIINGNVNYIVMYFQELFDDLFFIFKQDTLSNFLNKSVSGKSELIQLMKPAGLISPFFGCSHPMSVPAFSTRFVLRLSSI
jgi:hypothetical protein